MHTHTLSSSITKLSVHFWTLEETRALISVWGNQRVQSQLDTAFRNRLIYERVEREMRDMGYSRSWEQCRTKIKNLSQRYRKVRCLLLICAVPHYKYVPSFVQTKDANRISRQGRNSCPFYEELDTSSILSTAGAGEHSTC